MPIPDFIPDSSNSPFSAAGFQDWIPPTKEQEEQLKELQKAADAVVPTKKKALPINELQREDLSDEDLRDIGIDPARYKKLSENLEDEAIANLAKTTE